MSASTIDHVALGLSRVAWQYKQSPKYLAFLTALLKFGDELERVFLSIEESLDIDKAVGKQLDIIGDIVGVSRIIPDAIPFPFFGFADGRGQYPFGEKTDRSFGARFRELTEAAANTNVLKDAEYRMLIRARIVKNHSKGTPEDIIAALVYLFQTSVEYSTPAPMHVKCKLGRNLSLAESSLLDILDILPRPSGVTLIIATPAHP